MVLGYWYGGVVGDHVVYGCFLVGIVLVEVGYECYDLVVGGVFGLVDYEAIVFWCAFEFVGLEG